ncbi:MAG: hypothetical protein HY720_01500 [Planctomycetes bacterium]|nr:hypothetical protein [Planctomycetota bacterium]
MRPVARSLRLLVLVAGIAPAATAVTTTVWETSTEADFTPGKLENVVLSSQGRVLLGHKTTRLAGAAAGIWSVLALPDGRVYFGTGNSGEILALKDGKLETALSTGELLVTSLAADLAGNVYAGTIPGGKIVRIAPDGTGTTFAKLPDPYVWSLVHDGTALYAGTGPEGIVYRIDSEGRFTVHYDTTEKNVLSLAEGDGALFAGTEPGGLVFRIAERDKAFALADLDATEVRALAWRAGRLYAAANKATGFDNVQLVQNLARQILKETAAGKGAEREALIEGMLSGELVRIDADGQTESLYMVEKNFLTDVAVDDAGGVFVSTGIKGRVLEVVSSIENVARFEATEGQVLSLAVAGGKLAWIGADGGAVYSFETAPAETGVYTSPVHDAKFPSRWGVSTWDRTGELRVRLHAGNTPKPDSTWSEWTAWTSESPFTPELPAGRYLEYQVSWEGAPEGRLDAVRILYATRNQRPVVKEWNLAAETTGAHSVRKEKPEPKIAMEWKAEDPNGDALVYHVYYRTEEQDRWQRANIHEPITELKYEWDTETVPDGRYLVRLVASDSLDNVEGEALEGERISRPILVDNAKPRVEGFAVEGGRRARGTARDSFSEISRIEYSTDGVHWTLVAPEDGIGDETEEDFSFELPQFEKGRYAIAVRVTDSAGNVGLVRELFEVE